MAEHMPSFPIYWEKQESALCGTHAVNNLLQGPYYSEVDMATIAHSIDERERALMRENGEDSADYLSFMAQDSSNVDESGNFSINVIKECLANFGLECVNIQAPECKHIREAPLQQTAFICNLHAHWMALRRINGMWFNLNSLQQDNNGWGPTYVSDFYLDTLIQSLLSQKYSIHVVSGSFPPVDSSVDVGQRGRWFDSRQVVDFTQNPSKLPERNRPQAASNTSAWPRDPDAELARALAASMQTGVTGGSARWEGSSHADASRFGGVGDEEEQMRRAIELSMQDAQGSSGATAQSSAPAAAAASASPSAAPATAASPSPVDPATAPGASPPSAAPLPSSSPAASPPAATSLTPQLASATAEADGGAQADDAAMDEEEELQRAIELSMQQAE